MELLGHAVTAVILLAFYMLPSYVAIRRRHRRQDSIMAVDVLLGWTFVGWIVALAWSLTGDVKAKRRKR
ncbi:MAG: superinfection immunity protein [Rickettsiales bacterium]|jgi:hypothetical protein|nr:superinfection immunity protein [Rickettsiales bacterium]